MIHEARACQKLWVAIAAKWDVLQIVTLPCMGGHLRMLLLKILVHHRSRSQIASNQHWLPITDVLIARIPSEIIFCVDVRPPFDRDRRVWHFRSLRHLLRCEAWLNHYNRDLDTFIAHCKNSTHLKLQHCLSRFVHWTCATSLGMHPFERYGHKHFTDNAQAALGIPQLFSLVLCYLAFQNSGCVEMRLSDIKRMRAGLIK